MEQHLLAVIAGADGPFEKLTAFAHFQVAHATPEHAGFTLNSGLSREVLGRISRHTEVVKAALEEVLRDGVDSGLFAPLLNPTATAELVWGIVQSGVNTTLKYPDQRESLQRMVVSAIWASVCPQQ
jgi:hypothetical protein